MHTAWWWFGIIGACVFGSMLVTPAWDEWACRQHCVARDGVVVERFSSTGEAGTKKIGLRSNAWIRTSQYARMPRRGRLFDELVHLAATGTENVWVIDYRFSVAGHSAFGRSYVAQSFWSDVRAGSTVRVMYVPDDPGNNRLAESGRLRDVIVMALLALLCLGLAYAPQWLRDRKRNS